MDIVDTIPDVRYCSEILRCSATALILILGIIVQSVTERLTTSYQLVSVTCRYISQSSDLLSIKYMTVLLARHHSGKLRCPAAVLIICIICFSSDEMSALIGTTLLFSHTLSRLYRSVYVNVFSTKSNQDLLDAVSPYIYTVFVGVSLLSEAPALVGSGFGMYWPSAVWQFKNLFIFLELGVLFCAVWLSNALYYDITPYQKAQYMLLAHLSRKLTGELIG